LIFVDKKKENEKEEEKEEEKLIKIDE